MDKLDLTKPYELVGNGKEAYYIQNGKIYNLSGVFIKNVETAEKDNNEQNKEFICDVCGMDFNSINALKLHKNRVHKL